MNKHQVRRMIAFFCFLIFPLTLNYFSPYVSVTAAFNGVIAGSVLLFITLFVSAIFFRRTWCAYICPVVTIAEYSELINHRNVNVKTLSKIRYVIFGIWFTALLVGFFVSSSLKIDFFFMSESLVSIDEPVKFITYYVVLFTLVGLTLVIGKRGACHSICWMSPFLVAGSWLGDKLNLPQLRIQSNPTECISCTKCNKACPMSINVMQELKKGSIESYDCINCAECERVCPKQVLKHMVVKRG